MKYSKNKYDVVAVIEEELNYLTISNSIDWFLKNYDFCLKIKFNRSSNPKKYKSTNIIKDCFKKLKKEMTSVHDNGFVNLIFKEISMNEIVNYIKYLDFSIDFYNENKQFFKSDSLYYIYILKGFKRHLIRYFVADKKEDEKNEN